MTPTKKAKADLAGVLLAYGRGRFLKFVTSDEAGKLQIKHDLKLTIRALKVTGHPVPDGWQATADYDPGMEDSHRFDPETIRRERGDILLGC